MFSIACALSDGTLFCSFIDIRNDLGYLILQFVSRIFRIPCSGEG
jgi:hypothetical protein